MTTVTSPADMTPRERNEFMLARIRSSEPAPYQEGGYVLRVLTVPGRRTGQLRSCPIAVVQRDGQHYLCGPNRRRDWVRNLLAAGWGTVEGDEPARHQATLIESPEAAEVVAAYLGRLGRPSTMWPFPSDAPAAQIRQHLTEIAVLRLDPTPAHP
jgi:deazaflavin-dependent oxidoreductase (nitroreductase family)